MHAYVLLSIAKHDYAGHRVLAMHELEEAGHDLGLVLRGDGAAPRPPGPRPPHHRRFAYTSRPLRLEAVLCAVLRGLLCSAPFTRAQAGG